MLGIHIDGHVKAAEEMERIRRERVGKAAQNNVRRHMG